MGIFATRVRRNVPVDPEAGRALSEAERSGLPPRFEAVGEALASGSSSTEACSVLGRSLAQDGRSLQEVLDGLRQTWLVIVGEEPAFADIAAICEAWSESTLSYLHQMSCEDPMTGIASLAHVRTRLSELYRGELRGEGEVQTRYALVVADLLTHEGHPQGLGLPPEDRLSRAMHLARLGDAARTVFPGAETIGRLGESRIVVLVSRGTRLGRRVALLRTFVSDLDLPGLRSRVWIEGLPPTDEGAAMLLTELARS